MKFQEFIAARGVAVSKAAGEHLFRQGDLDRSFYIVKEGLLKAYYLSSEGKESIKSFILPGSNIGSLMAGHAGQRCSFSLVCLRPCELVRIDFQVIFQAGRSDLDIACATVDMLLAFAMKKERREFELLCLSAEDRYRLLLENTPDILDLVTQNEIALYLGVTPVGLSRIKKRIEAAL